MTFTRASLVFTLKVRKVSQTACEPLFLHNEELIQYIHQWTVCFDRRSYICDIEGVGCLKKRKKKQQQQKYKCGKAMWPSAICCIWLRKHEYFQKSLLSFNRSHTGKKVIFRTDNTWEYSLGIIWWQWCGSFSLAPCHQALSILGEKL